MNNSLTDPPATPPATPGQDPATSPVKLPDSDIETQPEIPKVGSRDAPGG